MPFPFRPMLSHGRPNRLSVGQVVVPPWNLAFGTSKPAQMESTTKGKTIFSYGDKFGLVRRTKKTGASLDVKRKLISLRGGRGRSLGFDQDGFGVPLLKVLDIRKNRQCPETNDDHEHEQKTGCWNAARLRGLMLLFRHIHAQL